MTTTTAFTDPRARKLGRRIRAKREDLNLTQTQLAHLAGTQQAAISAWERGRKRPTLTNLVKLRNALGLTEDEFAEWIEVAS